jgi:hypothetical protein
MMEPRRLLALAAALNLTVCVGAVSAQTVIVRNAPPDSAVEVVLNDAAVGSSKTNDRGDALVPVGMSERLMKTETDAQVFVDICPAIRRVLIVERSVTVPVQEAGCTRRDMGGIFVVKAVSSLVVDVGGPSPTLLLRQGKVSLDPPRVWKPAPTGLVVFGGGAFTKVGNVTAIACGDVAGCSGDQAGLSYAFGAAYWVTPYLAAEGSYVKGADATAAGGTDTFQFNSVFETEILTIVGKVGVPLGPIRPYGQAGASYHQATFRTSQTMTGAEAPNTLSYELRTNGWSFVFGGGVEMWFSSVFGVYGEYGNAGIKGESRDHEDGSGSIDDRMQYVLFGARLRLGGW